MNFQQLLHRDRPFITIAETGSSPGFYSNWITCYFSAKICFQQSQGSMGLGYRCCLELTGQYGPRTGGSLLSWCPSQVEQFQAMWPMLAGSTTNFLTSLFHFFSQQCSWRFFAKEMAKILFFSFSASSDSSESSFWFSRNPPQASQLLFSFFSFCSSSLNWRHELMKIPEM